MEGAQTVESLPVFCLRFKSEPFGFKIQIAEDAFETSVHLTLMEPDRLNLRLLFRFPKGNVDVRPRRVVIEEMDALGEFAIIPEARSPAFWTARGN